MSSNKFENYSANSLFKNAIDILEERNAPEWITEQKYIKKIKTVEKVFNQIGLSSFRDAVHIKTKNEEKIKMLTNILDQAAYELMSMRDSTLKLKLDNPTPEQIEFGDKIYDFSRAAGDLLSQFPFMRSNPEVNNLKLVKDISNDTFKIKKGKSLAYAFNELEKFYKTAIKNSGCLNYVVDTRPYDKMNAVQTFNNTNIKDKDYYVVFNSGDEGIWDVCTMSQRGIGSCQSWDSDLEGDFKKSLIGSILSKHVGLIYLTSGSDTPYGEKMMSRCVIRLLVQISTRKPVLMLDQMYPGYDKRILNVFIESLKKRTNIPVIEYATTAQAGGEPEIHADDLRQAHDPTEGVKNLEKHEKSYMDTGIKDFDYDKRFNKPKEIKNKDFKGILGSKLYNNWVDLYNEYAGSQDGIDKGVLEIFSFIRDEETEIKLSINTKQFNQFDFYIRFFCSKMASKLNEILNNKNYRQDIKNRSPLLQNLNESEFNIALVEAKKMYENKLKELLKLS